MATAERVPSPDGASAPALDAEPGEWVATRDAPVGGQAVLEGVMMRGVRTWAVACRKPAADQLGEDGMRLDMNDPPRGEIAVETTAIESILKRHRLLRLPIVRGVFALGESLVIGFKALGISANAQLPEEERCAILGEPAPAPVVAEEPALPEAEQVAVETAAEQDEKGTVEEIVAAQ